MNKITLILLVGIVVSSLLGAFEYSSFLDSNNKRIELESRYNQLQEDFEKLNSDYSKLASKYQMLNATYLALNETYFGLSVNYADLYENYALLSTNHETLNQSYLTIQTQYSSLNVYYLQLTSNYLALNTTYNILNEKYNYLEELFNQPLDYVIVPTWDEVTQWLAVDKTDEIAYNSSSFLCGDFSIMLIQHAKAKHWRMLFTVIEFDYASENPTGIERHHGNNAHVFVSIFTTEGIVYIEPQTDYTWYLHNTGDPQTHVEFTDWEFIDFGQDWFGNIFVQYYNRMATDTETIRYGSVSIEVGLPS